MYKSPDNNRWYLVGVITAGLRECEEELELLPKVATEVARHKDLLKDHSPESCFLSYNFL